AGFAGAVAAVAALRRPGRMAALGAETMALMPVDQAARLRQDRSLGRRELRRDRAHIDELDAVAMQGRGAVIAVAVGGEMGNAGLVQAEKDAGQRGMGAVPGAILPGDAGRLAARAQFDQRLELADRQE